jgi:hypothetical protein
LGDVIDTPEESSSPEKPAGGEAISLPVLRAPSAYDLRDELQRLVLADLMGPADGEEEEVSDRSVRDRYLVGMLAPKGQQVQAEEQDDLATDGASSAEEGPVETTAPAAPTMFPSSFGMSFCVDASATELVVEARWGQYKRIESATLTTGVLAAPKRVWKRTQHGGTKTLPLVDGPIEPFSPDFDEPDIVVQGRMRLRPEGWIVTLFLVNTKEEPTKSRDSAWIFQPQLNVTAPDGSAIFRRRMEAPHTGKHDEVTYMETQGLNMIYRDHVEFAVGHGVSTHAEQLPDDPTSAVRLTTSVVPQYEVPRTAAPPIPGVPDSTFDMKVLCEAPSVELPSMLTPLADAYERWIAVQTAGIDTTVSGLADFEAPARQAMRDCKNAIRRIREGIALLSKDKAAAEAFRFANRAMWEQRVHTLMTAKARRGEEVTREQEDIQKNRSWRPFQLAFILLNLPSLTDLRHKDRIDPTQAVADLLWFPTGGGKTEAYLGLTAYTLAMRRLQGEIGGRSGEAGVAVLMRYTLRLLTLQQFQRAAALLCACESIRREAWQKGDRRWGTTPFRLGLWVGNRTTPNSTEGASEAIREDHGSFKKGSTVGGSGTPHQLTNCPWCGAPIDPAKNIVVDTKGYRRTFIYCGDPFGRCLFTAKQSPDEGLPVLVVDDEIYRLLPSLLIATVDKFAQMPWNGKIQALFGQVDRYCPRHGFCTPETGDAESHPALGTKFPPVRSIAHRPLRPPDLIIQDELHLISGPLGSLVGLYETVIDRLCQWEVGGIKVRPKVVASTATIRRAPDQVRALFLRDVCIFPPQGLDADDNFFSNQIKPSAEEPGRRYIGICANGKRLKAALIRVYVAFLGAAQRIYEQNGILGDPWMTLVGYFNSMNELGGMRRLVEDDVSTRLGKIETRGLATRRRIITEELTSRKSATDIPDVLNLLETPFDPKVLQERSSRIKSGKDGGAKLPVDVLLATNMISVGVDVSRLGLMVVAGQPKNTAEYIQATSRVGRASPGLVCTVYNWARPRDLSHYETFEHYHATFYKHVEALSVTPFAPRARDRGLAALLVAYMRLLGTEFNANEKAAVLNSVSHPMIQAALKELSERAALVSSKQSVGEDVRRELAERVDEWLYEAQRPAGGRILGFRSTKDGLTMGLLHTPEVGPWQRFTCLNSLRDVEPAVNLILDDRRFDTEEPSFDISTEEIEESL